MKVRDRIVLAILVILATVAVFKVLIGENIVAIFSPAGPVAGQERSLIVMMVFIMLVVVVPMFIILYTIAWKYRAGNPRNEKINHAANRSHSIGGELILWAIPVTLVAILSVLNWNSAHALDPSRPLASPVSGISGSAAAQPLTIQVVALPWKWLFIYPKQNIATVNFIEFPVGTPIHFDLTADAPMSSFWIPRLGSQIYAMAAMKTQINLLASTTGEYTGKDTEINGAGYAGMTFKAKSTSQSDFKTWVASIQASGDYGPLTPNVYCALAAPSAYNPPAYYSSVSGDMFDTIMMKYMAPM